MYSQNSEEQIIADYFRDFTGTLLDIGANDGKTFSNSLALIERGWSGVLVEPDIEAYNKLFELHKDNKKVYCYNIAIMGWEDFGEKDFYESGTHLNKEDTGLLSTLSPVDYEKWKATTTFKKTRVVVCPFYFFLFVKIRGIKKYKDEKNKFDFITIDAEGMDYTILTQIDLKEIGCKCLCVEHNGNEIQKYIDYCAGFGMKEIHRNAENLIYVL